MRLFALTALAFIVGLVAGWSLAIAAYVVGEQAKLFFDRDGGIAMGFIFTIGPFLGLISGTLAAVFAARRIRRGEREKAAG